MKLFFNYLLIVFMLVNSISLFAQSSLVDQQTKRRITKTGITAYDSTFAYPGFVLFCPNFFKGVVNLINLKGEVVHQWVMKGNPGLWGYLLPNGNLFYTGKSEINHAPEIGNFWNSERGGLMQEVDWNNNVVWEYQDDYQHHDARRTQSGGVIYLAIEKIPENIAEKVKGGKPDSEGKHGMFADVIIEVDAKGNKIWEWHAWKYLDPEADIINHKLPRHEWTHGNTIVPIGNDSVVVSFRGISTVLIINKQTNEVVWKMGEGKLAQQHDPQLLDNGNLLVFNNGTDRKNSFVPYSEALEIELLSKKIVWKYGDKPNTSFFSPHVGGVHRLPNGNTLITEGWFGRIFQVTNDGKVVWEYVNQFYERTDINHTINSIFRARHYHINDIPQLNIK